MLRPKKNKEKSRFKDIKRKIKDLKNKLGHVVSGKMAKKLKNKKAGF
jgi:protein SDA1